MTKNYQQHLRRSRLRKYFGIGIAIGLVLAIRISGNLTATSSMGETAELQVADKTSPTVQSAKSLGDLNDENWLKILQSADACRVDALMARSVADLKHCLLEDSSAYQNDSKLIEYLIQHELVPSNYKPTIRSVKFLASGVLNSAEIVQIEVTDELEKYQLIRDNGEVIVRAGRGATVWKISLTKVNQQWLVSAVVRA